MSRQTRNDWHYIDLGAGKHGGMMHFRAALEDIYNNIAKNRGEVTEIWIDDDGDLRFDYTRPETDAELELREKREAEYEQEVAEAKRLHVIESAARRDIAAKERACERESRITQMMETADALGYKVTKSE